jgi:hypothetical protein
MPGTPGKFVDRGCGDTYTTADKPGVQGMTLRDWFAGQAMKSLLLLGTDRPREVVFEHGGKADLPDQPWYFGEWDGGKDNDCGVHTLARDAYYVADAMIAARSKGGDQ